MSTSPSFKLTRTHSIMTYFSSVFPSPSPFVKDEGKGEEGKEGYPFVIPDLWKPSCFALDDSAQPTLFPIAPLQETVLNITKPLDPYKDESEVNLFTFDRGFAEYFVDPDPGSPTEVDSIASTAGEAVKQESSDTSEDIWLQPGSSDPPVNPQFQTWESFLSAGANNPVNPYLSEAGPQVFDAVLTEYMDGPEEITEVVRTDVFCTCLLHLGLGRSSVLFTYNRKKAEFLPIKPRLRISGCTAGTVDSIIKSFADCGKKIKQLQKFVDDIGNDSRAVTPSIIALADCTTAMVESIQQRLSVDPTTISSVLHLHSLMREPSLIIDTFHQIISQTAGISDDSRLLTTLFEVVQQEQHRSGWLKPLLMETLARVTRPWLESIEEWIGLGRPAGGEGIGFKGSVERGFFVKVEEETYVDERGAEHTNRNFIFDKAKVPSFMSAESGESLFESGKSLRFLQKFHPNHPLSRPGAVEGVRAPILEWKFSWEDLNNLQSQATSYERELRSAVNKYSAHGSMATAFMAGNYQSAPGDIEAFETFGKSKEEIGAMIDKSVSTMNSSLPPIEHLYKEDLLRTLVLKISRLELNPGPGHDHLTAFAPPISITPVLSFSHIFAVQAKIINTACLNMFFKGHKVREHLSLLRKFELFGDGVYSSRLSHALFGDELDGTEKRGGVHRTGGTMGLKLGSRDSWPPASSELRLALMGVLDESFDNTQTKGGIHHAGKDGDLPGGLSFGVRDMTMEELERCMDPNGLEALDFLKLQYKPPSPLDAIITTTALYQYDRLFKLLLRVLRMLFVVNKLFRDATSRGSHWHTVDPVAQKFRIEARHFVDAVCSYMFETGVGSTWRKFEDKLQDIERKLDSHDSDLGAEGIERLRVCHESILDRIMFATLSRKRQAPVMKLMEDIFTSILTFAKYSHAKAIGARTSGDEEIPALYTGFKRRVGIFISVCRGLSEKRGYGDGMKDSEGRRAVDAIFGAGSKEEGNLLSMLLLRLEMTEYYTDTGKGDGGKVKKGGRGRKWPSDPA
ncbi:Spc98 family-domain-containing protein [Tuber brumale]|nr:Spc98 family-domain-containing protein [Tuber brumale]